MTRSFTGLCVASAFAFVASAAAQSTTTTPGQRRADTPGHEVSVTGCLAKSGDGSYMLTNARVEPAGSASTTSSSATTTAGSATTTTPTGTSGSASAPSNTTGSGSMSATTWVLQGASDLDKHVGQKVTVTGNATWNGASGAAGTTGSTAGAAGSTATTTAGSAVETAGSTAISSNPRLDVQSVKMVASTCS